MSKPYFTITPAGGYEIDVKGMAAAGMSLCVATPVYSSADPMTDHSLQQLMLLMSRCGIPYKQKTHRNNSLIPLARDILAAEFMATGFTHMLFVDADIVFQPDDVLRMMAANMDVLGGVYARRFIWWDEVVKAAKEGRFDDIPTAGMKLTTSPKPGADVKPWAVEVDTLPTGFLLIKREVVEAMHKAFPERKFALEGKAQEPSDAHLFHLFPLGPKDGHYCGEDTWFCHLAKQAGFKLYADTMATLGHVGQHTFLSDPRKLIPADAVSA